MNKVDATGNCQGVAAGWGRLEVAARLASPDEDVAALMLECTA